MLEAIELGNFDHLPNDHRRAIMCNGVRNATKDTYEKLFDLYNSSSNIQILQSIGCIENEEIMSEFILNYEQIPLMTLFRAIYTNGPTGLNVVLNFLKDNQEAFHKL